MLLFFVFFLLFSPILSAPQHCEPSSFCFSPNDDIKVTIRRENEKLNLKLWSRNENLVDATLLQGEKMVRIKCDAPNSLVILENATPIEKQIVKMDGATSCQATISIDNFDKTQNVTIKAGPNGESTQFGFDSLRGSEEVAAGLTKDQRRQFSKAHAILMILGWLFFVPTGFLFARLGKDLFANETLFGSAVWFQIHRAANFMGVVCMCSSILCIFISQQWKWKGTGSGSKYWTEWHTDLGIISTVLAVSQPLNSLLRCGPTHSKRIIFNWAHRCVGILSYSLAITTIIIAAVNFKKIWNEPLLELVLVALPTVLCLAATVGFAILERDDYKHRSAYGDDHTSLINEEERFDENAKPIRQILPHILRVPTIFWAIGVFFGVSVALSLLVVNGYKNV